MRALLASVLVAVAAVNVNGVEVRRFSTEDNVRAEKIMGEISGVDIPVGDKVIRTAKLLIGTPSGADAENDTIGTAMINLQHFTPFSFVNSVLALVKATEAPRPGLQALDEAWVSLTRRRGEDTGFSSKFIYGADWIVDNIYRGNLKEMTELLNDGSFKTKSLDYVTRNADKYPALSDSATFDRMKMVEMGFKSHKIPHLKKQTMGKKEVVDRLQNGDIIVMLSPKIDFDVYDLGFIEMRDNVPYLIHVNDLGVVEDSEPLSRYFKVNNQYFYGYRILRPE